MKDKSKEELIELLEERDQKIEELEQEVYEANELGDEVDDLQSQIDEFNTALTDREEVSEKAFYAGYNTVKKPENSMKAWLNFKMENRL